MGWVGGCNFRCGGCQWDVPLFGGRCFITTEMFGLEFLK